ncbi:F-box domain, Phloem protein 2-like protein [Quillaja saponaria]|uniref:F-box domain, Phloem protein 2-like protein n=1 Tax=Quillaja saponaria TaxID=32244 RepID=A0AAD7M3Q1_QUISA|nr:F-box domain, Phloem protein 2-like protein [Quillaja saponaria]
MLYSKGRILTLSITRSNELMLDEYDQEKRHMGTSWSQGEEETSPSMSTQSIDQTKLLQPSQIHENKSSATNNAVEKSSTSDHQLKQLHHNSHQILEDASSKSNTNSSDSNSNSNGNSKSNSNGSFVLPARKLSITWSENDRYWKWTSLNETSDKLVEVAELKAVCWLEVHGNFRQEISHQEFVIK